MKGFTTTKKIGLKGGDKGTTPFIRLVSKSFDAINGRTDCCIEVCKNMKTCTDNEKKIDAIENLKSEIKNNKNIIKNELAKVKGRRLDKNQVKELSKKITPIQKSLKKMSVDLQSLPLPDNIWTKQYPCFNSSKELTDGQIYGLLKKQYPGVKDIS